MSSNFAAFKQHEYTQDEVRAALKQAGLVALSKNALFSAKKPIYISFF